MYNIEITKTFEKQFKTLEKRASSGKLNNNNYKLLKKLSHCLFKLIENPYYASLNTSPYKPMSIWLSKVSATKVICYHSYIENHTSSAKRIYWYFESNIIKIIGVALHPKENSNELPKFKDLAKESLIYK